MEISDYVYSVQEFEAEARYIEALIWDAIGLRAGERILICGYGDEARAVRAALERGATVTVIESRDLAIVEYADIGATLLRGSTSVIPARDASFDLGLAYHYLHEVDPLFHSQILGELARVAGRVAVVEPAPPSDPLGKRIAALYAQAKRTAGLFERYQNIDHWKRLMQGVKAELAQHTFAFAKVPPPQYLRDTVALLLDTMKAEAAPEEIIEELRAIARRSDAQILPPVRNVLVGAAVGDLPAPLFTARPPVLEERLAATAAANAAAAKQKSVDVRVAQNDITPENGYEFPPLPPPPNTAEAMPTRDPGVPTPAFVPPPSFVPTPAFVPPPSFVPPPNFAPPPGTGFAPPPSGAPFPPPFAVPPAPGAPGAGLGWQWEPPDSGTSEPPA
ncbi:MAG: class I SAM-dependent methyltransferase [Candidatus Baltobacteraceae bacterium]